MPGHRQRPLIIAATTIVLAWLLAWGGYELAQRSRMTLDKMREMVRSTDFGKLSSADRKKVLLALAKDWNELSPEERRGWRWNRELRDWFVLMSEEEKEEFIDATVPAEIKQALANFEQWPEARRRKAIDDAMNQLKNAENNPGAQAGADGGSNAPPISPELENKIRTLGLKTYYSQSSAQTKAELAPLLNEIQRQIENGQALR